MTYGTPEQVAIVLGRSASSVTEVESAQWQAWLDIVESAIVRRFKRAGMDLATQVGLEDPSAQDVAAVEVAAVVRKVHNPDGMTSTTVSVDDGSITKRRDAYRGGDPLALDVGDWDLLLPSPERSAWSTRPGFESDRPSVGWLV